MTDTPAQQIAQLLAGTTPSEVSEAGPSRWRATLPNGERVTLLQYPDATAATTAAAALRLLDGQLDQALPQLRAVGAQAVLVSDLPGEPLSRVVTRIPDGQRYELGRALARLMAQVHSVRPSGYGALAEWSTQDGTAYALARYDDDAAACAASGLLSQTVLTTLRGWVEDRLPPDGRPACLVHGGLSPDTVQAQARDGRWALTGISGWDAACGWAPGWEHTTLLENCTGQDYFGLRVGYGHAYQELNERGYEHVHDLALVPFRVLRLLRMIHTRRAAGDHAGSTAARNALLALTNIR